MCWGQRKSILLSPSSFWNVSVQGKIERRHYQCVRFVLKDLCVFGILRVLSLQADIKYPLIKQAADWWQPEYLTLSPLIFVYLKRNISDRFLMRISVVRTHLSPVSRPLFTSPWALVCFYNRNSTLSWAPVLNLAPDSFCNTESISPASPQIYVGLVRRRFVFKLTLKRCERYIPDDLPVNDESLQGQTHKIEKCTAR